MVVLPRGYATRPTVTSVLRNAKHGGYREIRAAKHVSFRGVLSAVSAARTAEINAEDGGENRRNKQSRAARSAEINSRKP